ncbi:nitrous oxide reductase accessory protein NosL [Bacillus massilinigeriensis]|uniref:nitrous oxide reductase accessory protein NosL n=1 Tax=Bacillus mediterraneensis TaxID=1805474 RepID=UPI0008F85333|nr:nitrous oxide reductase accessory protein NosL [Bacillus mediterraneensis]
MNKKFLSIMMVGIAMLIIAACGKDEVKPAAIKEDSDKCEVCNMAVVDGPHATQIVLEDGKSMVFDDIGCMYGYLDKNKDKKFAAEFVRDYHDKEWIKADKAFYVYNKSVKTPMAYNVVSFKDEARAKKFADKNDGSTILSAEKLEDHSWERNRDMMMKNKMKHHSHSEGNKMEDASHEKISEHDMKEEHKKEDMH